MTMLKLVGPAILVAGVLGLANVADAAPLSPAGAEALGGSTAAERIAYGCGPGFAPNRFGYCRPIYRPYGYGYGPRRFYGGGPRWGDHPGWGGPRPVSGAYGYGPRSYY